MHIAFLSLQHTLTVPCTLSSCCCPAASQGFLDVLQLLLVHGAAVNAAAADNTLPLHAAAFRGHTAVVQLLLDRRAAIDGVPALPMQFTTVTPLHHAAAQGHLDVVRLLLDRGAAINGLPADGVGMTPLHAAAFAGRRHVVQLLIERGADVTAAAADHSTPLHMAASQGHAEVVQLLLMHGADATAEKLHHNTPLLAAAIAGRSGTVELLISHLSSMQPPLDDLPEQLSAAATAAHRHHHQATFAVIARELGRLSVEDLADLYQELGVPNELLQSMLAVVLGWCQNTQSVHQQQVEICRKEQEVGVQLKAVQQLLVQSAINIRSAQRLQQGPDSLQEDSVESKRQGADDNKHCKDGSSSPAGSESDVLVVSETTLYQLLTTVCILTVLLLGVAVML